ncbi:MAG: XRE family transcriptional regulator [Clostridia bacterium]|nr:XRE family transcriptional regulator [Clostridia bacterium]
MKHAYKDSIKSILHRELIKTIEESNLTQEETAEILGIDVRSLAYLKAGTTMCSSTTLLIYLTKLCKNPTKFLEDVEGVIKELEQEI